MVIMSDVENFCLKMACVILGMFGIGLLLAYLRVSSKGPEVIYREPEVIVQTDTLVVHDTVYKYMPTKKAEIEEQITSGNDTAQ